MGFLRRNRGPSLPANITSLMERFGRHEIDPIRSSDDGGAVFTATQQPLLEFARVDPDGFVDALAAACVAAGGWATYGGERTVVNLVGFDLDSEAWLSLLDGSTQFLRANYVPPMRIPGYMWNRFIDQGGSGNSWLPLRPGPTPDGVRLTPLAEGEVRKVAKLGPEPDANLVLVRKDGNDHVALIEAKWSDEDPTRSQSEWKRAASQFDLYIEVGWATQVWDWADPELEPFFPAPRALI